MIYHGCTWCDRELDGHSDIYCLSCSELYADDEETTCGSCGSPLDTEGDCTCALGSPRGGSDDFYGIRRAA